MKTSNQIQQFYNEEFGSIGILMIDGKPYFPATECAIVLGYKNPHDAILKHCPHLAKREVGVKTGKKADGTVAYQTVFTNFIPEGDLYRLIIRSKLPAALRFEAWVCDEILPAIRRHGAYATSDTLDELLRSPQFARRLIKKLEAERDKSTALEVENAALEDLATEMAPKALYCDAVLQAENLFPVSVIAKDYGMGAASFNALLHDYGIQFRAGGTWLLYAKYANRGYTRTTTYSIDERIAAIHTRWTQKGRMFLYEFLKGYGILPLGEYYRDEPLPA